jgi:DNA-3-methyladenine glycosylase II
MAGDRSMFYLEPVPPFRLDLTAWTLRRRPDNAVDRWDGHTYRRVLAVSSRPVEVAIVQVGSPAAPRVRVSIEGSSLWPPALSAVESSVKRLLGIDVDLAAFYRLARRDENLGALSERFRGMKPPRFPTIFESLVNAIACQQLTLTVGIRLLNSLAAAYSPPLQRGGVTVHPFPRPVDLAGLDPDDLRRLGFSRQKGRAIIELALSIAEGRLELDELAELDNERAVERLRGLRGVGRWTAEYVLLRGLGRTNVFPGDDVGARNNLRHWLRLTKSLDYETTRSALGVWKGYSGLVYFHLLLNRLAESGYLDEALQPPSRQPLDFAT